MWPWMTTTGPTFGPTSATTIGSPRTSSVAVGMSRASSQPLMKPAQSWTPSAVEVS